MEILALDAGPNEAAPTLLDIFLEYCVRPLPHSERLVLSLNLSGENVAEALANHPMPNEEQP